VAPPFLPPCLLPPRKDSWGMYVITFFFPRQRPVSRLVPFWHIIPYGLRFSLGVSPYRSLNGLSCLVLACLAHSVRPVLPQIVLLTPLPHFSSALLLRSLPPCALFSWFYPSPFHPPPFAHGFQTSKCHNTSWTYHHRKGTCDP